MKKDFVSESDSQITKNNNEGNFSNETVLDKALSDLAKLIKPLANDMQTVRAFYYLLLMWASFHVYPLKPLPSSYDTNDEPNIIPLSNGWQIIDYGYVLSASPGENYGSYCTGKLIETAKEIIRILVSRGVTEVGFSGHEIAKRAAWIEAMQYQLAVKSYQPNIDDLQVFQRIQNVQNKYSSEHLEEALDRRPE